MTEQEARKRAEEKVIVYMMKPDIISACESRNIPLMKGKKNRPRFELEEDLIEALVKEYTGAIESKPAPAMLEVFVQ